MLRALFSGVTGLNQNIVRLDVIGNNIANVNTVGYKSARVSFGDAFSQTLRGGTIARSSRGGINPIQVGSGVRVQAINSRFDQGNIQTTGGATDVALQGSGFFIVNNGEENFYSRAGNFTIDSLGRITQSGTGYIVQGYGYDNASQTSATSLSALTVPFDKTVAAHATEAITLQGNLPLDSEARATVMELAPFDDASTGNAATSSTLLSDLRSNGGSSQLLFAGDAITIEGSVGGTNVLQTITVAAGTTVGNLMSTIESTLNLPSGSVTLESDGTLRVEGDVDLGEDGSITLLRLTAEDGSTPPVIRDEFNAVGSFTKTQNARDPMTVIQESLIYDSLGESHTLRLTMERVNGELAWTWNAEIDGETSNIFGGQSGRVSYFSDGTLSSFTFDDGSSGITFDPGTGANGPQEVRVDFGSAGDPAGLTLLAGTNTLESKQDGYATGHFLDFAIDGSGRIFSLFSNGVTEVVGDFAVARFNNPTSLVKDGDNLYTASLASGEPTIRSAGEMAGTSIVVGAIEQSNVDLAQEFSEMIITQRAFQANARVITTSSEILSDLMQLTR